MDRLVGGCGLSLILAFVFVTLGQKACVAVRGLGVPPPSQSATMSSGGRVVALAHQLVGRPYRGGGTTPGGFDCSGFVFYVYRKAAAFPMPRGMADQRARSRAVSTGNLQAGDLVFFRSPDRELDHVGIFVGNGVFIHAARKPGRVVLSNLGTPFWKGRFLGGRRVFFS